MLPSATIAELRCMQLAGLLPFAIDWRHGRNAGPAKSRWLTAYSSASAIVAVIVAGLSLRMFALELAAHSRRHSDFRKGGVLIEDILMALQVRLTFLFCKTYRRVIAPTAGRFRSAPTSPSMWWPNSNVHSPSMLTWTFIAGCWPLMMR